MRKTLSLFSLFLLLSVFGLGQAEKEITKRIETISSLIKDSKFDRAVSESSELVAAHPYTFESHMVAFQTLFQASRHDPKAPESTGYLEKAFRHLIFARRVDPDNYEAWESSLSFWDPGRVDPKPRDPEAESTLAEAQGFFSSGELDKATAALTKVVNREPTYAPAYLHLGEIYLSKQQPEDAVKFLKIATDKDPRDSMAFLLLASAYGSMEKNEDAIANLVKSLKADPGFPVAWQQLTRLDLNGKKVERMALRVPKSALWVVERELKEPADKDFEGVSVVARPAWKAYASSKIRYRQVEYAKRNPNVKVYRYTFSEESAAISDLLAVWKETKASHPEASDPLLDHWLAANQASALDAAIFMDLFVEEFRPDFNTWIRQNPTKFEEYFYKFVLPPAASEKKE